MPNEIALQYNNKTKTTHMLIFNRITLLMIVENNSILQALHAKLITDCLECISQMQLVSLLQHIIIKKNNNVYVKTMLIILECLCCRSEI